MARIRPTIALKNDRAGRNRRKRPAAAPTRAAASAGRSVNWSKVRLWSVSLAFAGLWLLLWARAYQVQIIRGPQYAEAAKRAHLTTEVATGRRGSILDRNGNVLAKSVEAQSVAVRPALIKDKEAAARLLAAALHMPPAKARQVVSDKRPFVWAARKVGPQAAEAVRAADMRGVLLHKEYERVYPFKHLAGQLLGFVNVDDKGIEGLELSFEESLSGQKQRRVMQRDAAGRRLYSGSGDGVEDLTGESLRLTLDTQVQFFAESALLQGVEEFGARWAGCMVVNVPSGDILAWAEYPFFNPNRPAGASPFERRNKTAMDALELGSTIKPFLMAAALEEKLITPETRYNCEKGKWRLRNVTIRDTRAHDELSAKEIIKYSSNIGIAKIGMQLGAPKYHAYLSRLGFGDKTGLPLAGENKGIVRPAQQWSEVDLASASFGQSFSATLAQMAQAYLCIANDGVKKNLRLVAEGTGAEGAPAESAAPERVFSTEVTWQVREMLRSTVEDSGGTARRARIDGISVGGKTGTAQKASGDTYGEGRVASFAGMFPVEAPQYLVVVILDEPRKNQYGGVIAAPVFKNVAVRTMAYHGLLPEGGHAFSLAGSGRAAAPLNRAAAPQAEPARAEAPTALVNVAAPAGQGGGAPSVVGLSARKAVEAFARQGLVPEIKGEGAVVVRQVPEAGAGLPAGAAATGGKLPCAIWLGERS